MGGMNCHKKWLKLACLKSKGKLYLKRRRWRFRACRDAIMKNGQGKYTIGTSKAESESVEAKQKVREVIEMNNKWAKGYKKN